MLSSHLFLWKTMCYSQLFYFEMCFLCWNVSFCFPTFHRLPIYPIVFQHPVLLVGGKQCIAAMNASKQTGSEIADSILDKSLGIYLEISINGRILNWTLKRYIMECLLCLTFRKWWLSTTLRQTKYYMSFYFIFLICHFL